MPAQMSSTQDPAPRAIRSFVRRAGRITSAQRRALSELWPLHGIDFSPLALDFDIGQTVADVGRQGQLDHSHPLSHRCQECRKFVGGHPTGNNIEPVQREAVENPFGHHQVLATYIDPELLTHDTVWGLASQRTVASKRSLSERS